MIRRRWWFLLAALLALSPFVAFAAETTTSPDQMSDFALYGILLGAVGTYITAALSRVHWPSDVRFGVFFAYSVLAAAGNAYFQRSLDWHHWSRAFLVVMVSGVGFYNLNKGAIQAFNTRTTPKT